MVGDCFFFNDTATTEIYTLSLHDALPIFIAAAVEQLPPDPPTELARRALRVRDHEHGADINALVADSVREPLDEDERLPRARAGRDEDVASRFDCRALLRVRFPHARLIRHIRQSSHQGGQSPPLGSCCTSPVRIRSTKPRASSCARST